ncbi:MAG TPA: hypothetical protein VGR57_06045 [Ktedonobacterales bacterium]|nr:hypothetical protein [Ktedonobacterales bacterium]
MVAGVSYFGDLTPEQEAAQEYNSRRRFNAALQAQEGFIGGYLLRRPDGRRVGMTIWESAELMQRGFMAANAVPLLPGQDGSLIPGPESSEIWEVLDTMDRG